MKIFSKFKQPPRKAVYIVAGLFVVGLFVGHVLFINKVGSDISDAYKQQDRLREEILKEVYPDPEERRTHYSPLQEEIEKSRLGNEYKATEARITQLYKTQDILVITAFLGWPLLLSLLGGVGAARFWKGKGLDETKLQARQNRIRIAGTFITAAFLTLLLITWRFVAAQHRASATGLVTVAFMVATVACFFVQVLWGLMSSPVSRLRPALKSAPMPYRIALFATVVAGVAFVTIGDLNEFATMRGREVDSLIFIGVQSSAWLAIIISIGSVMLGYVRLPSNKHIEGKEKKQTQEPIASPPNQDGNTTAAIKPLSDDAIDLAKVYEKVIALASLLESSNQRSTNGTSQTTKKPRAQRSDEVVRQRGEAIRQRLLTEVQSLTRRGNLNLIIGSLTSLIAATILWMLVAQAPTSVPGTTALVGYYVPRLSVAVFIEVFSFFFLRLYKNGLSEIMYYQNELTNLESKMLALEIASLLPSADSVQQILQDLAKTDRNTILKSGESTVELEKIKADQQNVQSLFDNIISKITDVKEAIKVGK